MTLTSSVTGCTPAFKQHTEELISCCRLHAGQEHVLGSAGAIGCPVVRGPDVRVLGFSSAAVSASRPRQRYVAGSGPACVRLYQANQAAIRGYAVRRSTIWSGCFVVRPRWAGQLDSIVCVV